MMASLFELQPYEVAGALDSMAQFERHARAASSLQASLAREGNVGGEVPRLLTLWPSVSPGKREAQKDLTPRTSRTVVLASARSSTADAKHGEQV